MSNKDIALKLIRRSAEMLTAPSVARRREIEFSILGNICAAGVHSGQPAISASEVRSLLARDRHAPATIRIDSDGGDIREASRLHDAIRNHLGQVETIVPYRCSSAATVVLAAGDHRIGAPESKYFCHLPRIAVIPDADGQIDGRKLRELADRCEAARVTMLDLMEASGVQRGAMAQAMAAQNEIGSWYARTALNLLTEIRPLPGYRRCW